MGSVISADFLANEVRLSRMQQRTTLFLCNLAMFIVKNALRLHYGEDYSVRCLQASRAFQLVLERIGLQARETRGSRLTRCQLPAMVLSRGLSVIRFRGT